jgi:hypothetical protein
MGDPGGGNMVVRIRHLLVLAMGLGLGFLSGLPGSFGDDIIMKDGEVIEGKVLQKQTAAANKGVTDPNQMVYIVQVDESGKTRRIRRSQIKYIMAKKPSWEVRKANLAWYEKQSKRVKDTRSSQESFARQCSARRLDSQANRHYLRALELRRKDLSKKKKVKPEDYMKLAQWCRKAALLDEEKKEVQRACKMKKEQALEGDKVKGLLSYASWLKRYDMDEQAITAYEEVLKLDPGNRKATGGIKQLKSSSSYQLAGLANQYIQAKRAWKIKVAIEDNANAGFMKEWEQKLKSLSDFIFEVTEGQFFVYEWILEDQTSNGKIIIEKGKMNWKGMNSARAAGVLAFCRASGTPRWEVHCPGKTWESVLCHEMFHGIFGLLDEYYQNPQCPCIMRSAPNPQKICNPQTHIGGGRQKEPCWNTIKKRYKDVVSPNPNWTYTKEDIKGKGKAMEVDGYLRIGGKKVPKAPLCKVIIIDK